MTSDANIIQSSVDRLAIRDLVDAYHAAVNMRDLELLASLFTEDAVWEAMPPVNFRFDGRTAIRDGLRGTISKQEFLIQSVSGWYVDKLGEDEAAMRSTMMETGRETGGGGGWRAVAFYYDRAVKGDDGQWQFARRTLHLRYMERLALGGELFDVPPRNEPRA
jgi:uncharacterized protein (TIGR02246 family)